MSLSDPTRSEPVPLIAAFLRLWSLGLIGCAAYALEPYPSSIVYGAALPEPLLRVVNFLVSSLVLAALVAIGCMAAPHAGLHSRIAPQARSEKLPKGHAFHWIQMAFMIGVIASALQWAFDQWFWRQIPDAEQFILKNTAELALASPLTRLLYGAITEELMLRFGLMGGVLWVIMLLLRLRDGRPPAQLAWVAIIGTATLIALGNLPAVSYLLATGSPGDPAPLLLIRTIAVGWATGIAYGWLYWKHGLEAAILAHLVAAGGLIAVEGLGVGLL